MFSFSAWLAIPLSFVIGSEPVMSASARNYVSKLEGAVDVVFLVLCHILCSRLLSWMCCVGFLGYSVFVLFIILLLL